MERKHISGYSIFEYWAGKKDHDDNLWILDPGEKTCFKCGHMDYEIKKGETLQRFWNKRTGLEKAHIVPHALGGTEEPYNIIFLCSECHAECPDTIDYGANLKWISEHRKGIEIDLAYSFLSSLTQAEIEVAVTIENPSILREQIMKRIGMHGFSVSNSSMEVALRQVLQELID